MSTLWKNSLWITLSFVLSILIIWHSRIIPIQDFVVNGNYEFFKSTLFTTFFVYIFCIFYFTLLRKQILEKKVLLILVLIYLACISWVFFSQMKYNSLFWWDSKWHGFIFINSLFLIFLFFYLSIKKYGKNIFENTFLTWWIIIIILWIKELFFPSFEYWALGSRMLSSLWHPNYVAAYLIMLLPFIYFQERKYCKENKKYLKYVYIFLFILVSCCLFLTQSAIAIWLLIIFLIYQIRHISFFSKNILIVIIWIISAFALFCIAPEKFSSFISRYYIWETTLKILFSDIKIFIFWIGYENLIYFFDNFKSQELYLYERFGYSASRAHNIFLDTWLNVGFLWFIILISFFIKILKKFDKNYWYYYSALFWFIFYFFHFPSVIWYIFLIFIFALITNVNNKDLWNNTRNINILYQKIFIYLIILIGFFWSYYSYNFYIAETYAYKEKYQKAIDYFPYNWDYHFKNLDLEQAKKMQNNFITEKYLLYKIYYANNPLTGCDKLVQHYPSVENYFYCWDIIEKKYGFEKASEYYKKWLNKFPDIYSQDNKYLNSFVWKYIINIDHVESEKFSDIKEIMKKLESLE